MKRKFLTLILILIIGLSCRDSNFQSEGIWIGVNGILVIHPDFEKDVHYLNIMREKLSDTIQIKKAISFKEDSITLSTFNETLYYGFDEYKLKYNFSNDSLLLENEGKKGSLKYFFDDRRILSIEFDDSEPLRYRDYFTQIEEFKMSHKKRDVDTFLTNSPILIGQRKDKVEILPTHFNHMGDFIQDSLETNYGYGNDWYLYTLEQELFLIIGNYLIHISEFNDKKISGFTYNNKASQIEIKKSPYTEDFNPELLIGNWIKIDNDSGNFEKNGIQRISFSDKYIIVNSNSYTDTLEWKLNKYSNKVLLRNDKYERHGKYWKIKQLSKYNLVLKRKIEKNWNSKIEVLTLKKE